jgi:hypothetical protein
MEIDDKLRVRADSRELWLLRLQAASRLSPPAFGIVAGAMTFAIAALPITFAYGVDTALEQMLDGALFFALTIGILAGFCEPVYRGAVDDLEALSAVLPLSGGERRVVGRALVRQPAGRALLAAGAGLACGVLHCWLMATHRLPPAFAVSQAAGTLLVWLMMWSTMSALINNALIFSALGTRAAPDLLRPSRHAAFGRAALRPALFVIGLLCAYSILAVGGGLTGATLIAFCVTISVLCGLFFLPLIGIRRRIRDVRRAMLLDLDRRIDGLYRQDMAAADAEQLFELDAVLDIRERVARASAWPLDLAGVRRILLYVVLPPLTWAAAALVEILVDQLL